MANILVVDDNALMRHLLEINLKREGYTVFPAEDGQSALSVMEKSPVHLIIADIMMPKMDGYELTDALRKSRFNIPILMITAKETFADKKKGFETGADDYMVKPVDMDEMLLRVKALLRRAKISSERKIEMGNIILDYDAFEIATPEGAFTLPKKEFNLLFLLLSYPDKIFTRQELMDEIWGYDAEADERTVDVHIRRLREKFESCNDFEIVTIRGLGYKARKKV